MAAVLGCTIVKAMTYRGTPGEEFSSTYHFKNPPPSDDPSWTVVMNDVLNHERPIYPSSVTFVRFYGYNSDDDAAHHVFAHDWTVPGPPPAGTFNGAGLTGMAGDQAACVWWKVDRLSSRGKPVYLRKYHHHGFVQANNPDGLDTAYQSVLSTYAGSSGIQAVQGGLRSRRINDNVTANGYIGWVTTRTLKRRGKRPRTAP